MKLKRLKKLLMGQAGLSRNEASAWCHERWATQVRNAPKEDWARWAERRKRG